MGETEVTDELQKLISKYDSAKKHAESLLSELESHKGKKTKTNLQ
jgi:molybdenum-dependent DNA-binding transcriptional regulator ModE